MKRILLLSFLLLNIKNLYAQAIVVDRDAFIITKKNDTIKTIISIQISGNIYSKEMWVCGSYFDDRIYFTRPTNTNKKFIKSTDVRYMQFKLIDDTVEFVSNEFIPELVDNHRPLFQQMKVGKLNWYKSFYWDSYNYVERTVEIFFLKGQETFNVGVFNTLKNKLKKITVSRPDLIPKIDALSRGVLGQDKQIGEIVTAYNEK